MALSEDEKYAAVLSDEQSPLTKLLGTGTRPMRVVDFPGDRGNGTALGIWNLYQGELQQARLDAIEWITKVCKVPDSSLLADASIGDEETKNQILFRALRNPANPAQPFCKRTQELRDMLTPDEREALYSQYLDFVDERSPLRKVKSVQEVDELVSALGKKGSRTRILVTSFDIASLRSIVLSLAERCLQLTKGNSSDTSSASGFSSLSPLPSDE